MSTLETATKTRTRTGLGLALAFLWVAAAAAGISWQSAQRLKSFLPNISALKNFPGFGCITTGPSPDLRIKNLSVTSQQVSYSIENVGASAATGNTIVNILYKGDPDIDIWSLITTSSATGTSDSIPGNCGRWPTTGLNTIIVNAPSPLIQQIKAEVINYTEPQINQANNTTYYPAQ